MDSTYSPQIMIRSVSIIIVWIFVVEASRIILHSESTDADRGNGSEEEQWINEMVNGDYNDDDDDNDDDDNDGGDDDDDNDNNNNDYEAFTNENTEDSDIHKDKINEWKSSDNDNENLINDESKNDNNIVAEIITNNSNGNESNGENVSEKEDDDEIDKLEESLSSTKEANIIDYTHSISSAPKHHIWMEKRMIGVVVKKNVRRVKRASRAGNSRKVKVMQERRNNRLDSSNTSENWNHHKHKVTES
ncbi:hypothetical protein QQG55_38470 [Brugia pahangi]